MTPEPAQQSLDLTQDIQPLTSLTQSTLDLSMDVGRVPEAPSSPRAVEKHKLLGRGRLGQVWSAARTGTGQKIALKFLQMPVESKKSETFRKEVEDALAPLLTLENHPNLALITDVNLDSEGETDVFMITMPLYEGSLGRLARQERYENLEKLIRAWIMAAAEGLEFLHSRGIYHGDFQPENVLLDKEGAIRLSDFGLSGIAPTPLTGVYYFMPPEQSTQSQGPSAQIGWDIYALGATFYYVLTGECPRGSRKGMKALLDEPDLAQRCEDYRHQLRVVPLKPLKQLKPGLDRRVCETIERCLDLDPRQRYASAAEIIRYLEGRARKWETRSLILRWWLARLDQFALNTALAIQVLCGVACGLAGWRHSPGDVMFWLKASLIAMFFSFTMLFWRWREKKR